MSDQSNSETPPLVSVCVLTYNTGAFVSEAIESVREGNYPNLEFILIDDASDDDSARVLNDWAPSLNARTVFRRENKGVVANCNLALEMANGKYLFFIGDDLITPSRIEEDVKILELDESIALTAAQMIMIDGSGNQIGQLIPKRVGKRFGRLQLSSWRTWLLGSPLLTPSITWRTASLRCIGGWPGGYEIEDKPMFLRLSNLGCTVNVQDKVTTFYRRHGGNLSMKRRPAFISEDLRMLDEFQVPIPRAVALVRSTLELYQWCYSDAGAIDAATAALRQANLQKLSWVLKSKALKLGFLMLLAVLNPKSLRKNQVRSFLDL